MRPYVVLYDSEENVRGGDEKDSIAAKDAAVAAAAVEKALEPLGKTVLLEAGEIASLPMALEVLAPRVVFNLVESLRGVSELEACVAGLLDLLGVAYTGNTAAALSLCLDKHRTKNVLRGAGIPVPPGVLLRDPERDSLEGLEYPLIVKPACLDASHGIEPANVVQDERAARAKARELQDRFGRPAVAERFVDGRELNVSIVDLGKGPEVLPLSEIDWRLPPGVPRVVGYGAKWVEDSEGFAGTPVVCPASLGADLERLVREAALASFEAVGARDYVRVDVRVDASERPFVIEVNPNPCLAPDGGLARSAAAAGWSYDELVRRLASHAELRGPLDPLARGR